MARLTAAAMALSTANTYVTATDGTADLTDTWDPYHQVAIADGTRSMPARTPQHLRHRCRTGHPAGPTLHLGSINNICYRRASTRAHNLGHATNPFAVAERNARPRCPGHC